jgi:hypothetical protein
MVVAQAQEHNMCPTGGEYEILKLETYCKKTCDLGWTCRGTRATDPCENGSGPEACRRFSDEAGQCLRDMNEKNKVIIEYNGIVRKCHQDANRSASPSSTPRQQPQGRSLADQLREANQQADQAKAKAREAEAAAAKRRAAADEEKNQLKNEAKSLPSWCPGMVSACRERAASLANASSATQSQCSAYCQILQIEDCNGTSPTVNQAAQACNSGAQRDQRQAGEEDTRRARCTERACGQLTCWSVLKRTATARQLPPVAARGPY